MQNWLRSHQTSSKSTSIKTKNAYFKRHQGINPHFLFKELLFLTKINQNNIRKAREGNKHNTTFIGFLILRRPVFILSLFWHPSLGYSFISISRFNSSLFIKPLYDKKEKKTGTHFPPRCVRPKWIIHAGGDVVWTHWDCTLTSSHSCFPVTLLDSRSVQGELGWVANPTEGGVSTAKKCPLVRTHGPPIEQKMER